MDYTQLSAYLDERTRAGEFSGVVRIDRAGRTDFADAYGPASRAWNVPCHLDTRFDTASITKVFTAVAVLQQVERGAFDLHTPVTAYLELSGTAISDEATVYHLLTHTSGMGDDADEEAGEDYADVFIDRPNYSVRQIRDLLPQFVDKPANFAPGEGCRYCNCSYVLLGLMVERATGTPYRDYVGRHVFGPAGMDRSGFFAMDVVAPDVAEGADPVPGADDSGVAWRRNIYSYPPIGSPDGGAHVTAGDLIRFHEALVDGTLVAPKARDQMLTPKAKYGPLGAGEHWTGFGFEFEVDGTGSVANYWKEGKNAGASGILTHYPKQAVTVVVLSNMQEGAWEPIERIQSMFSS